MPGSPGKMLPTNPTNITTKASDKPMICSAVTTQYYRSQLLPAKITRSVRLSPGDGVHTRFKKKRITILALWFFVCQCSLLLVEACNRATSGLFGEELPSGSK